MKPVSLVLSRPFDRVEICGSRFWGNPDLPKGYGYPVFEDMDGNPFEYQFICQINLSEIAPFDTENRLPHKGLLSFFAKIDRYLGRFDNGSSLGLSLSSPEDVRVLYFPEVGEAGENANPEFDQLVLVDDDGWNILLEIDSFSADDFILNFVDFGVLDFLISPEDLAARRFDRVRAIVLSS